MSSKEPRVGIERKILTSILWVGILPMTVALIIGYITARGGQRNAVQQTLLTAASKTAEGLYLISNYRLQAASALATDPDLLAAVQPDTTGRPSLLSSPSAMAQLTARLTTRGDPSEDGPSIISLYDLSGKRFFSTDPSTAAKQLLDDWTEGVTEAEYCSFSISPRFSTLIIVPLSIDETPLGYMTVDSGVRSQMRFATGQIMPEVDDPSSKITDFYQYAYIDESNTMIVMSKDDSSSLPIPLRLDVADPVLHQELESRSNAGSLHIQDYKTVSSDTGTDVLLAYHRVGELNTEDQSIYLVVYRPTSQVFSSINLWASLALGGCILFIALLCVNAYRNVHNNIVRPISLLNEGAQIVRQGDFDLKLKIGTGDEIEELASSFNDMALALKGNIRRLEESERSYRSLVTSMRDGIYQTDLQGTITFLNPAGADILGLPGTGDAIGTNIADLFIESVDMSTSAKEEEDPGTGGGRSRLWMRRWDEQTICVELSRNPVYDDNGQPIGMEGIFRDVTLNVQLEEEARERSERISAINQIANVINSSLEAGRLYESLVVELKKLVDFDYASVALLSSDGASFDGRQLWPDREVHPGHTFVLDGKTSCAAWVARERRLLLVDDLHAGPSPFVNQFPEDVKSCLCVPLYASGRIIGTLNLGANWSTSFSKHDVEVLEQMAPHLAVAIRNASLLVETQLSLEEVTRAREKLHEANEELKTLDEMKTNLLSNVSHELRTPLVSVMGYNDMILNAKAGPINNTQREYLEISLRNIEKLVTLIENLLDFSRLHRGDERLVFDTFDLADCVRTGIQVIQPVSDSRNISVDFVAPVEPVLVEGDKEKMGQVFNNLLGNAVKFNHNGGSVRVELELDSSWVEVSVSDTGIGIPAEAHDKVFTRFYQYDSSSTRKYGGTGIGLSIAQDIVRLHGSLISVASKEGEGSSFRFRMNLRVPQAVDGQKAPVKLPLPEETHLLVELVSDDRALGHQVRDLLLSEGMDLIHASSPDNAIALAQKHRPDCILVDVHETTSGASVLERLLAEATMEELPIVILTNDDDLYERYRTAVSARIKRSFRKSSLLSGIHHALNKGLGPPEPVGDQVLCVDDDPEILTFMRRCLEVEGFSVECCESGEEALELVTSQQTPDNAYGLILLDIAMPGIDGWRTCREIKSDPQLRATKIYMVTAKPIDPETSRIRECGADGFLLKPFRPEDLVQLVHGLEIRSAANR